VTVNLSNRQTLNLNQSNGSPNKCTVIYKGGTDRRVI